jgi:hypothetical protein
MRLGFSDRADFIKPDGIEVFSTHLLVLLDYKPNLSTHWFYVPIAYLIPVIQCACLSLWYYTQVRSLDARLLYAAPSDSGHGHLDETLSLRGSLSRDQWGLSRPLQLDLLNRRTLTNVTVFPCLCSSTDASQRQGGTPSSSRSAPSSSRPSS